MLSARISIDKNAAITDIVRNNHHTADVFKKYDIEYCCGGKWSLETVCMMKGLPLEDLQLELQHAGRKMYVSPAIVFNDWGTDFLTSYITHVHHQYLKKTLQHTGDMLKQFADGHQKKYPQMQELVLLFEQLKATILPHIDYEEEAIFPYICQVVHAYENNDSYAKLLVKTLRKPLNSMMNQEKDMLSAYLLAMRKLSNNYFLPENACTMHRVSMLRLQELDDDMMQHIYLEHEILFPRAISIEKEILK